LDPYAVLGLLGFLVFLFYVIYNFINNNGGRRFSRSAKGNINMNSLTIQVMRGIEKFSMIDCN
jgi:hypothetical protein